MKCQVIVWGVDDYNTLGLLRQINESNIKCHFLVHNRRKYCATVSNCCKSFSIAKTIEAGIDYLKRKASNKNKVVLITNSDIIAEVINENKDWLEKSYYLMGTKQRNYLGYVSDKNVMCNIASQCNINVPFSREIKYDTIIDDGITYPCILKPSKNSRFITKEFKTKICKSEIELKSALQNINKNNSYILQKYINKKKDVLIYGCRFNNGEIVLAGSFIKDRWYKNADGSHGILTKEIYQYIDVDAMKLFLKKIDYYGLFSFEYGIENSVAFFYEVNLRNDGTSHYFWQAGANLPLAWIYDCYKLNTKKSLQIRNLSYFIDEIDDYDNVRNGLISKYEWKMDLKNATIFKYYSQNDIKPYLIRKFYNIYKQTLRYFTSK